MNKAKHTPLPWKNGSFPSVVIAQDGSTAVADCRGVGMPDEYPVSLANAEFIVRACNNHYELLAACKAARENIAGRFGASAKNVIDSDVLAAIDAAIAKAEGGAA